MVSLVPSPKMATTVSSGRSGIEGGAVGATGADCAQIALKLANASKQKTFLAGYCLVYHVAHGSPGKGAGHEVQRPTFARCACPRVSPAPAAGPPPDSPPPSAWPHR